MKYKEGKSLDTQSLHRLTAKRLFSCLIISLQERMEIRYNIRRKYVAGYPGQEKRRNPCALPAIPLIGSTDGGAMNEYLKWYQWNPYTFWNDSRIDDLTLEDMAIYRSLLDHMWMHKDCMLLDKDSHNAHRTRAAIKEYRSSKSALIECGLITSEDGWLKSPELTKIRNRAIKAFKNAPKNETFGA